MYKLTLTNDERKVIDWHGHRYQVSMILQDALHWPTHHFIEHTWEIHEHVAWGITDAWDDEGPLACASDELNGKLKDFMDDII